MRPSKIIAGRPRGQTYEVESNYGESEQEMDLAPGEKSDGYADGKQRKSAYVHTPWSPTIRTSITGRSRRNLGSQISQLELSTGPSSVRPKPSRFYLCDCSRSTRRFSVACPGLYNLLMWIRFAFGRLLVISELLISLYLAELFQGKHAWYFTYMVIFIMGPYVLCWNVGLKLVYNSIYSSSSTRDLSCFQKLQVIIYIFPLSAIFIMMAADIIFLLFMTARFSCSVLRGDSVFKDTHSYLEEFRGVASVLLESLPKATLLIYILTLGDDEPFKDQVAVLVVGFVISMLNFCKNLFLLIKQAERQSMSIFQYIFFRLQLAEVSMPAYVPDIFRIYEGFMKVGNYTDVEFGAESASQLMSALNSARCAITTLRFAAKTLRSLDHEAIRSFGKSLEDFKIIWTHRIKPIEIRKLWSDMNKNRRSRYITKDRFHEYCESKKITKDVDNIFDEMAATYDNVVYQRDFYEWVVKNQSEYEFGLLDVDFPLQYSITENNDKNFMLFCGREDAYVADSVGQTPWMRAVQQQLDISTFVRYLRTDLIKIGHKDNDGRTLVTHLMTASKVYIIEFLRHLLEQRVNIVGLFYETFTSSDIPLQCITLYFDDEFYYAFDDYSFDYRQHVFDDYLPDYGFNSWVELIEKHNNINWNEVRPQWVGKYFDEHVIRWYFNEYGRDFSMHSVAEGLVQREDGNGIKLIIDCCPPEVIKDAVEEMTRNGLKGEDLANEFIVNFEMIGVPINSMALYFDEEFVRSLDLYLDYRSLFNEENLRLYGFKSFQEFIGRFHPEQLAPTLNPRNIGRFHDHRVIAWYLGIMSEHNQDVAREIWEREDENLFLLISACNVPTIIKFMLQDSVEVITKKFNDIYDVQCPNRTIFLFYSEEFTSALMGHGFDFQDHVLKYIYKRPRFQEKLRNSSLEIQAHVNQMVQEYEAETGEKRAKRMRSRQKAIEEFVSTEEKFHKQMIMIINLFMRPAQDSGYFSAREIEVLFPQVLLEIAQFTTELTIDLTHFIDQFDNESTIMSELLEPFIPRIANTFYLYCVGFNERLELRAKKEKTRACRDIMIQGPGQQSFKNLQPIMFQRPPRYGLLMKEICKQTPADHPDYHTLKEAYRKIDEQTYRMNDLVTIAEGENEG